MSRHRRLVYSGKGRRLKMANPQCSITTGASGAAAGLEDDPFVGLARVTFTLTDLNAEGDTGGGESHRVEMSVQEAEQFVAALTSHIKWARENG